MPPEKEDNLKNLQGSWELETAGWLREPLVSSGEVSQINIKEKTGLGTSALQILAVF